MFKFSQIEPKLVMISIIILSMVGGLFIMEDYGIGIDTPGVIAYGNTSLKAYSPNMVADPLLVKDMLTTIYEPIGGAWVENLKFYGPAFQIVSQLITEIILRFVPTIDPLNVHKYLIFLTFLAGVWFLYILCQRYVKGWTPVIIALAFLLQPLYFGHSFINSKDIPFMGLFIVAVALGFNMVDRYKDTITASRGDNDERENAEIKNIVINDTQGIDLRKPLQEIILLPKKLLSSLVNKHILCAGVVLGLTISVRNLGIAAGGIVGLLILVRHKEKAIAPGFAYLAIAALSAVASWPYMWHDPLGVFIRSIKLMSDHTWYGSVLFNGGFYLPKDLPISYLLQLISLQFTIPIIILSIVGFGIFLIHKKKNKKFELLLISLWFILPVIYVMIGKPTVYDNFRQFLFITPPLFVFAGLGANWVGEKINNSWLILILVAVLILPGIVGIIDLHPFQYIYYNAFTGGIDGAFRIYENDYWFTSYKQSMEYVNGNAESASIICVWGWTNVAKNYARKDLEIISSGSVQTEEICDYALLSSRFNLDINNARSGEVVYSVSIRDVILATVRKMK